MAVSYHPFEIKSARIAVKIKYSHQKLTFKISRDELRALREGIVIETCFVFPNGLSINHQLFHKTIAEMQLNFDLEQSQVFLQIPQKCFEQLEVPSKYGVTHLFKQKGLSYMVAVEVDLKSQSQRVDHGR